MTSKNQSAQKPSFFRRPLLGVIYWSKIDITDGLDQSSEILRKAKATANEHRKPSLPAFEFTESHPEWVLLYDLARDGQITPRIMRSMHRSDLYYLAGHTFPHPALTQPKDEKLRMNTNPTMAWLFDDSAQRWAQATKLQGNAIRAQQELQRRDFIWASFFVILAALIGAWAAFRR